MHLPRRIRCESEELEERNITAEARGAQRNNESRIANLQQSLAFFNDQCEGATAEVSLTACNYAKCYLASGGPPSARSRIREEPAV